MCAWVMYVSVCVSGVCECVHMYLCILLYEVFFQILVPIIFEFGLKMA